MSISENLIALSLEYLNTFIVLSQYGHAKGTHFTSCIPEKHNYVLIAIFMY